HCDPCGFLGGRVTSVPPDLDGPSSALVALSRRILKQETAEAQEPAALARSIERAFARLELHTCTLIGQTGFRALLARAVYLTQARWPWIETTEIEASASLIVRQDRDPRQGKAQVK